MSDSLIVGEQIELLGAGGSAVDPYGTPAQNPLSAGATYRLLAPSSALGGGAYDLGAPQPTTDIVGSLLLDGERPFGYRTSNRTITLGVLIKAPTFQALIAAREILLQEINEQTWSLRWTRDTLGPYAGNSLSLPLLFDCYRAQPSVVSWGAFYQRIPYGIITLTFQAMPFTRSDTPVTVNFQSPLAGLSAPPPQVLMDSFAAVPGNWLSAQNTSFEGGTGGWTAVSGCTIAYNSVQGNGGAGSLAVTATGTAGMVAAGPAAAGPPGTGGLPVVQWQVVQVTAYFRAATIARACQVGVRWYNAAGVFISSNGSGTTNDTTAGWTQRTSGNGWGAPSGAAYAVPFVQVLAPAGSGEVHYVDDVVIGYAWTEYSLAVGNTAAEWDPASMAVPTGTGMPAVYTNQQLAANLQAGLGGRQRADGAGEHLFRGDHRAGRGDQRRRPVPDRP